MKAFGLVLTAIFICQLNGFGAGVPKIFYVSSSAQYGANTDEIGVVSDFDASEQDILYSKQDIKLLNGEYSPQWEMGCDKSGNIVFVTENVAQFGKLKLPKAYTVVSYGNIEDGLTSAVAYETPKKSGTHFIKAPVFTSDGKSIIYYARFIYQDFAYKFDLATKKFSVAAENKFPKILKASKGIMNWCVNPEGTKAVLTYIIENGTGHAVYLLDFSKPKDLIKLADMPDAGDFRPFWAGDKVIYYATKEKNNNKLTSLMMVDTKGGKPEKIFDFKKEVPGTGENLWHFWPHYPVYSEALNAVFVQDVTKYGNVEISDIVMIDLESGDSEIVVEDSAGLFDVSSDGRYLLCSVLDGDPSEKKPWAFTAEKPGVIAVYDFKKDKLITIALDGIVNFNYLGFVEE